MARAGWVMIAFCLLLSGCDGQFSSSARDREIGYAHVSDGVVFSGRLRLAKGKATANWAMGGLDKMGWHDDTIAVETFEALWDSVGKIGDFKGAVVKVRDRAKEGDEDDDKVADEDSIEVEDMEKSHVVEIITDAGEIEHIRTYMIPAATASPEFRKWLTELEKTQK